jgi:hypothetical protein
MSGTILYFLFLFHPPTWLGHARTYISAWGGEFCQVSIFANFSCFGKIRWMPTYVAKPLEML